MGRLLPPPSAIIITKQHNKALAATGGGIQDLGTAFMLKGALSTWPLVGNQRPEFPSATSNMLGQGGFGAVRQGVLMSESGNEVSVLAFF